MRLKLVPIDLDGSRSFPSISEIGYLFSVIELDRIDDLTSIDVISSAFTDGVINNANINGINLKNFIFYS
jgi:hypothetical protein